MIFAGWSGVAVILSEETSPSDQVLSIHNFDGCNGDSANFGNIRDNNLHSGMILGSWIGNEGAWDKNFLGIFHSLTIYDITAEG